MTTSNGFHRFGSGHDDLVLCTAFNFYGTRMATAGSDHRIKVWDRNEKSGQWGVVDTWIAHDAEVTDVKWSGPLTGEHIASIGEDGTLRIWKEDIHEVPNSGRRFRKILQQSTATGVPYMSLDVKMLGTETYVAAITRDGHLSVFEPEDHDDLSSWKIMWADYLVRTPSRTEETGFRVSWHQEKLPAWTAVVAGLDRRSLSLVVAVGETARVFRTDKDRKFYTAAVLEGATQLIRDVSWANGSMRGFDMIATASKDGFVRIYELHTPGIATSSLSNLSDEAKDSDLESVSSHPAVRAPRSGIGAGLAGSRGRRDENASAPGAIKQDAKMALELTTHGESPWRVEWSPLADLLISTGDDGTVRLWKKAVDGKWLEAAEIDAMRDP